MEVLATWNNTIRQNSHGPQILLEKVVYLTAQSYITKKMNARRAGTVGRMIGEMLEVDATLPHKHIWTVCQWTRTLCDEDGPEATLENRQAVQALDAHLHKALTAMKKDLDLVNEATKLETYQQELRQDFATDVSDSASASLQAIWAGIMDGCEEIRSSVNLPEAIKSLSDLKLYSLLSCDNTELGEATFEHFSSKCLASLENRLGRTATMEDVLSCAGQDSVPQLAMCCVEYAEAIEGLFKRGKTPAVMGVLSTAEDIQSRFEQDSRAIGINDATTAKELFIPEVIRLLYCRLSS